jgi:hypothetical protein
MSDIESTRQRLASLAREVEAVATSARTVIERGDAGTLAVEEERLERVLAAWRGVRHQNGSDAQKLLVYALFNVAQGRPDDWSPLEEHAEIVLRHVAAHSPGIGEKLHGAARSNLCEVRAVLALCPKKADGMRSKRLWDGIADLCETLRLGQCDGESARVEYAKWTKREMGRNP